MASNTAPELPEDTTNTVRVYHALDNEMMVLHRKGMRDGTQDADCVEAERIAKMLLENADLPLVFRARACMILGLSSEPGYVQWAEEAVRVVNMGIEYAGNAGPAEQTLLEACEEVLRDAKTDYEELGGYEGEDEEEGAEQGEDEEEGAEQEGIEEGGELAGDVQSEAEGGYTVPQARAPRTEVYRPEQKGTEKKSLRVDSSRDVVQEWDEDLQMWVDQGPA